MTKKAEHVNKVEPTSGAPDQLVDVDGDSDKSVEMDSQRQSPSKMSGGGMAGGMGGAGFGATMQGFKLDEDSSEEDVDALPEEMRAFRPTRIDKKKKMVPLSVFG